MKMKNMMIMTTKEGKKQSLSDMCCKSLVYLTIFRFNANARHNEFQESLLHYSDN